MTANKRGIKAVSASAEKENVPDLSTEKKVEAKTTKVKSKIAKSNGVRRSFTSPYESILVANNTKASSDATPRRICLGSPNKSVVDWEKTRGKARSKMPRTTKVTLSMFALNCEFLILEK